MKFNSDILGAYAGRAPLALAFERTLECRILCGLPFERPILDLGCGDGTHASVLFAEPIDTGIDPDARELEHAASLGAYAELINCRGDAVPKPDGSYRTVISNSVLEHIPDLQPVFREIHRLLAVGGRFHFTVPSPNFERYTVINLALETLGLESGSRRFRRFFNEFWVHHHAYPPAEWAERGRAAGFELVDAYTFAPPRTCLLNTMLTPLAAPAKVSKAVLGRWSACPPARRAIMPYLARLAAPILRGGERSADGGLVFVSLRKV